MEAIPLCLLLNNPHLFSPTQHTFIKVFYSPTDAHVNCLKNNFKFTLKLTLQQLLHVSVQSPSSGRALLALVEITVVKLIN
jgi:hypothetical protein